MEHVKRGLRAPESHSPALTEGREPMTVNSSRCPGALTRRTQKPVSSLKNVTRSITPESLSVGVLRSGAVAFIWTGFLCHGKVCDLLKPFNPASMRRYEVSSRVNLVKNNDAACGETTTMSWVMGLAVLIAAAGASVWWIQDGRSRFVQEYAPNHDFVSAQGAKPEHAEARNRNAGVAINESSTTRQTAHTETNSQHDSLTNSQSAWPQTHGEYVAGSSESIPNFPKQLSGYRPESGQDFWAHPFRSIGTLRIFEGNDWNGVYQFPNTMNGCDAGVFMIRWRAANPNVRVESSVRELPEDVSATTKIGSFGYMSGSNCQQPMFKFAGTSDAATLTDIYYELKFWQAAP